MDLLKNFHVAYTKVFQGQTIKNSRAFVWLHNMDGVARRVTRCEPVKVREERIGVRTACAVEHDLVFEAVQQRHALVLHCCVYKRAAVRHKRIGIIAVSYTHLDVYKRQGMPTSLDLPRLYAVRVGQPHSSSNHNNQDCYSK